MNKDLIKKLQLYRTENVGTVTYRTLINKYSPEEAVAKVREMAAHGGKASINIPSIHAIEQEMFITHGLGAKIIETNINHIHYPPILTILGKEELLERQIISGIGTRLPSIQGLQYTKYIVEYLGSKGYVLLSGFAKGIDTQVHESTLKTGTIAFLPCGIDVIFPSVNYILYNKMKTEGLLITDRPLGQQAVVRNFPLRNRYLVLLSKALLVLEAKINSGSIMTGNFALKYKVPLFAVPGHPLDIRYSGNNILIKNGAILLDHPDQVIERINNQDLLKETSLKSFNIPFTGDEYVTDTMRRKVILVLNQIPVSLERICEYTMLSLGEVNYIVLELELAGKIERSIDDKISMIYSE